MLIVLRKAKRVPYSGGDYFYQIPKSKRFIISDIRHSLRNGDDVRFEEPSDTAPTFLTTIKKSEPTTGDTKFLNRIIRGGGLIPYLASLGETVEEDFKPISSEFLEREINSYKPKRQNSFREDYVYVGRPKGYQAYDPAVFCMDDSPETHLWYVSMKLEDCSNTKQVLFYLNDSYNLNITEFHVRDIPKSHKRNNWDNSRLICFKSGVTGTWYAKRYNNSQHMKIKGLWR